MNYTIGINSVKRIEEVAKSNILTVYCGYVDNFIKKRYPEAFNILNRRGENASLCGKKEFKKVASEAEKFNISIYVTFNGMYTSDQYNWLIKSINFVSSFSAVKGIICSDLGLLLRLKQNKYNKDIVISTGGSTFNSSTVSFYKQFGIKEIVLDRQLKINEIEEIISKHRDIKFEIFLSFSNCLFVDGFCSFLHSSENPNKKDNKFYNVAKDLSMCGVIYGTQFNNRYKVINKSGIKININFDKEKTIRYAQTGCNLCAVRKLKKYSDNIIYKIISRGNFFIDEFNIIKTFLDKLDSVKNDKDRKELFKKIFGYECNEFGCYANEKII